MTVLPAWGIWVGAAVPLLAAALIWLHGRNRREAALAQAVRHCETLRQAQLVCVEELAAQRASAARVVPLEQALATQTAHAAALQAQVAAGAERLAAQQRELDDERRRAPQLPALLGEARQQMGQIFAQLADEVTRRHGNDFGRLNKERLDAVLGPLQEKIGAYHQAMQQAEAQTGREHARLGEQLRQLMEAGAQMNLESSRLTRALKGEAQMRGAWGEMVLGSVLKHAGLIEGEHYICQSSHPTAEGGRLRPDVVVHLPKGDIILDAKVSLLAFEAYVNCADEAAAQRHLKAHLQALRTHISALGKKRYQDLSETQAGYVIMFVPIEAALAAAIRHDGRLLTQAHEANVAILSPSTLMVALRTVAHVWQGERRNKQAHQIAARAGKLYDKFAGFVTDMKDLDARLCQARGSFDDAFRKLVTGPGNLHTQVEELRRLDAKISKKMPDLAERDAPTG